MHDPGLGEGLPSCTPTDHAVRVPEIHQKSGASGKPGADPNVVGRIAGGWRRSEAMRCEHVDWLRPAWDWPGRSWVSPRPRSCPPVAVEALGPVLPANAPGQALYLVRYRIAPGTRLPLHHHEGTQIGLVEAGVLTYHVESGEVPVYAVGGSAAVRTVRAGETIEIGPGQWVVEEPDDHHWGRTRATSRCSSSPRPCCARGRRSRPGTSREEAWPVDPAAPAPHIRASLSTTPRSRMPPASSRTSSRCSTTGATRSSSSSSSARTAAAAGRAEERGQQGARLPEPGLAGGRPEPGGRIHLRADSDAVLVKGLISLLLRLYDRRTAREMLDNPPEVLERVGLDKLLTPGRSNGLYSMVARIQAMATAFASAGRPDASPT